MSTTPVPQPTEYGVRMLLHLHLSFNASPALPSIELIADTLRPSQTLRRHRSQLCLLAARPPLLCPPLLQGPSTLTPQPKRRSIRPHSVSQPQHFLGGPRNSSLRENLQFISVADKRTIVTETAHGRSLKSLYAIGELKCHLLSARAIFIVSLIFFSLNDVVYLKPAVDLNISSLDAFGC